MSTNESNEINCCQYYIFCPRTKPNVSKWRNPENDEGPYLSTYGDSFPLFPRLQLFFTQCTGNYVKRVFTTITFKLGIWFSIEEDIVTEISDDLWGSLPVNLLWSPLSVCNLPVTKRVEEWVLNAPIKRSQGMLGSSAGQKTIVMAAETRWLDFENGRPFQPNNTCLYPFC